MERPARRLAGLSLKAVTGQAGDRSICRSPAGGSNAPVAPNPVSNGGSGGANSLPATGPARLPEPAFRLLQTWAAGMKQRDLRALVIREWDRWLQNQPIDPKRATGRDSLKFFVELQDQRSALLDFQSRGRDKWQIVHAWLLKERRVLD